MELDANQSFCYLTTTGRVTGWPHEIEIWFGIAEKTLYLLSGGGSKSDWARNIRHDPAVTVRIGARTYQGQARIVPAGSTEDTLARRLLLEKYAPTNRGDLGDWGRSALPVAIDLADR